MSPFKFSLERVRQLRERIEKEAAMNLARAQEAQRDAHEATARAEADAARACEALANPVGGSARVGDLRPIAMLRDQLQRAAATASEAETTAKANVADERRSLGSAIQARRVLDRLRVRQHDAWKVAESREDSAAMDEATRARAVIDNFNRRS